MKTIFLSVQTGMVVRDLLRCGPLELVLSHPEARVVLLTPGGSSRYSTGAAPPRNRTP